MADLVMNFLEKALPTIGMVAGGALAAPLDPFTGGAASVVAGGLGSALGKFGENELTGQKATSGVMGSLAGGLAGNYFGGLAGDVLEGAAPEIANATGVFGKAMSGAIKGSVTGAVGSTAGGIAQGQPITGKNLSMDFLQGAGIGGITGGLFGGATAAVGNQVKPAYALDDETAVAAAKEQDPDKVEKILEPKTGPVVAKDVAPAVAKTSQGDPAIVKNIVQDDLNNKLSTSQQATTPVSPDTTTQSPAPAQMPPTTSVSDINTPQQVAQQGSEATQAFMNAPGETNGVTKIMEESNPLTKNRGFLQTLQKSTNTTPELEQAISEIEPQTYTQKPNDPMVARAKALVDTNYDTAVQRITGSNHLSDEDITIGHQLLSKAQAEGRSDDAVDLATRLDNSLRDSGREVQAASIWGRMTPEGMLRHAANVVNQAKEAGKKAELTPEVTKKINDNMEVLRSLPGGTVGDTAKNIREAVNQSQTTPTIDHARGAVQDSISNLQQALPLEGVETRSGAVENTGTKVAKNVEQAAAPPKIKPKVDQLVNEITKKVKQEMLEPKPNTPSMSATDILKEVFGRNQEAQEAFPYAQRILMDKYANSPQMMDALDKFFNSKLGNPAASGTFERAISEQLKANQNKVSQIIARSWRNQQTSVQEVSDNLTKEGFDKPSADAISKEVTTRMAQRLQDAKTSALQKLAQAAPERAQPTILDKINKLSNLGALDNSDYLDLARARLGFPDLSPEASQRLSELSQQIQDDPNGDSKLIQEVHDLINSQVPSSLADKIFVTWRAGLLTGPQTVTKIVTSHAVNAVLENVKDVPGSAIDKFVSLFTGQRSLVASVRGAVEGFKEGTTAGKNLVRYGIDKNPGANTQEFRSTVNFGNSVPGKIIQAYVNGVGRIHGALYKPFFGMEHLQSLYNQAIAAAKTQGLKGDEADDFVNNFVQAPPPKALDVAQHDAEMFTFQQTTKLGQVASALQQKGGIIGKVIAPFTKIPSAIATDLINYSPVGGMKTIIDGIKMSRSDEGWTLEGQRQFSQGLGRSIVGAAAIIPGIMLYSKGLITLGYPSDAKEQALWQDEGKQPDSVLIGGQWRKLGSLGPFGSVLSIGAYISNSLMQGQDLGTASLQGMFGGLKSIEGQSYLSGVSNTVNALNSPGSYANSFLKSTAGSIIPTGVNTLANATDQYQRNTTGNNPVSSALNAIKGRVPGLRETLPTQVDAFGNPLKSGETGLERIIDPFQSTTAAPPGPLLQELRRLDNAGFGEMPAKVTKKENFGTIARPDNVALNQTQIRQLTQMIGQATEQAWWQATQDPGYSQLTDVEKQATLSEIYSSTANTEKNMFAQLYKLGPFSPTVAEDLIKSKQKAITPV